MDKVDKSHAAFDLTQTLKKYSNNNCH